MDSQETMMMSRPMVEKKNYKVCPFLSQKCFGQECAVWDDEFECCSLKNTTEDEVEDIEEQ